LWRNPLWHFHTIAETGCAEGYATLAPYDIALKRMLKNTRLAEHWEHKKRVFAGDVAT